MRRLLFASLALTFAPTVSFALSTTGGLATMQDRSWAQESSAK